MSDASNPERSAQSFFWVIFSLPVLRMWEYWDGENGRVDDPNSIVLSGTAK